MSEDTQIELGGGLVDVPNDKSDEPQYSDVEKQALERGWKPKDQYEGDPGKWRTAEVFVALEEPLTRIEKQSKELKQLRQALEAFKDHHSKVKENEYNRALKAAKEAYRSAMVDGDTERALQIQDRVEELKEEKDTFVQESRKPVVEEPAEVDPRFVRWTEQNPWYNDSVSMRRKADSLGNAYLAEGVKPEEVLKLVEKDIKKLYPEKFENQAAKRPMAVEPSSRGGGGGSKYVPTPMEKEVARKFAKQGIMTEAEYYKSLQRLDEQGA
jgi:hypothetical protein